ncbi:MAG TPA: FAD-binding oxidoreductase [Alphaproteobacteria bacterium]|nr:FAD-binding oxidoreductase [Alphaproteobacteria bacterium]
MAIAPGVSAQDRSAALEGFAAAVGKDWVFTSDADLALYKDAYSPFWGEPEEKHASAAVAPQSSEEVQAIMRIANKYKIPIYPISTGRNLGYGGSAPVLSGSVVLDLKRMNKVLEVNEENAFALVEPGVSYFDLYRYIREHKLKLWIDCPDPGWGSPIGNSLDHGGGKTTAPYRDHFGAHCGMEVVLANGEIVRTGMGALPGAKTWQQFQYGYGPYLDGIFSQSNFGVVTKMGFWLMAEPEAHFVGRVKVPKHGDLSPLMRVMNYLMNSGLVTATTNFGAPLLTGFDDPDLAKLLATAESDDAPELQQYAAQKGIPYWTTDVKLYGPETVMKATWEYAKTRFADAIPGVSFEDGKLYKFPLTDAQVAEIRESVDPSPFGIPSLQIFNIGIRSPTNPVSTNGHLWLSLILPMTGEAVIEARAVLKKAFKQWGISPWDAVVPQSFIPRSFLLLYGFPVTHDPAINKKNRAAFKQIIELAAQHGWGEYRTAPAFMDDVANVYSFNNHALRRLHEKLKDAVDPNGIISAGRYGIWPNHLRKT